MIIAEPESDVKPIKYPMVCYFIGLYLILCIIIAASIIVTISLNFMPDYLNISVIRIYVLFGSFGMLGATVASIRKYYRYLITYSTSKYTGHAVMQMDWSLGWVYYYLTRPILGAILGAVTYLLSFIGFQILAESPIMKISTKGKYFLFALAFLSGFSVSDVLDRLSAVSRQLFDAKSISTKGDR
ncbi:MAG: hypothetical protein K4571_02435 [Deltaproteobacteria bacterium]